MGLETALVGLAVSAVSGWQQHRASRSSARAQRAAAEEAREQARISSAAEEVRNRQQRRQAIREGRVRRARILAASEGAGVAGSSSEIGSVGALTSLTGDRLASLSSQTLASQAMGRSADRQAVFQSQALSAQQRASLWQGVGQLGAGLFQASGGIFTLEDAFRGTGNPSDIEVTDLRG